MTSVDLNADLGEGFGVWSLGDDDAMLDIVTSANVACGFHAGDPSGLSRICHAAARRGVMVGAQVSYRDLAGFGRRFIDVEPAELTAEIVYQIGGLAALAGVEGTAVRYVKPHGALYNSIVTHEPQAAAVADAVAAAGRALGRPLPVLGLAGSALFAAARARDVPTVAEAFADRAYTGDGRLLSRRKPGAVLHDPGEIARRVLGMVRDQTVTAVDGRSVPVHAESVCVHGDTPGAVAVAQAVSAALRSGGVTPAPFVSS